MDEKPRRRIHFTLDLQADTPLEMARALDDIGTRAITEGIGIEGASGGVGSGYRWTYSDDPEWTHERYFDAITSEPSRMTGEHQHRKETR